MGKKKIAKKSSEEVLKESAKVASAASKVYAAKKLKAKKKIQSGRIYIKSSYNNTVISVTDTSGNILTWASAGSLGFSGPKKATPFASSKIAAVIAERLKATGPWDVEIITKGVGSGRDSAIRSLINQGFNVTSLRDVTPVPHNGPRPPKPRRV